MTAKSKTRNLFARYAKFLFVACAALAASCLVTNSLAQAPTLQDQITQHEQKLSEARAKKISRDEVSELNSLGALYRQVGKTQKAQEYFDQAMSIAQKTHNRGGEAMALDNIGRLDTDLGLEQKALDFLNRALPIWREVKSRRGEAYTLNNIGRAYTDLGQNQKALDFFNQALPIWREVGGRDGEASCLNYIGRANSNMSRNTEALTFYNQALPIFREVADRSGEALTLNNIGKSYSELGEKQKTLEFYNQALPIWRAIGDRQGEASTLNYIGRVYFDLGQKQKALDFYGQALPLWRAVGNRSGEARALNDTGVAYSELGQKQDALDSYNRALPITREIKDRPGEALTLNYIGNAYFDLGQKEKALDFYNQSLPVWREVQNGRGEAYALSSIGKAYSNLGQPQKALPYRLAALSLVKAAGDPDMQGGIEHSLMLDFRAQNLPEEAIFFGTDAVNSFQQIRKNISGLDKDLQMGYANARSATYRELAELLVQSDRLAEAEQVLDLLKEQELKEVVRGAPDDAASKVEPLKLSAAQEKAQTELAAPEKTSEALTSLSIEYSTLQAKQKRTPAEDARLKTLDSNIQAANSEVSSFFTKTLYPELAQKAGTQNANALLSKEKSDVSRLQNSLAELGPRVMGIRVLFGEEHAYAIVVTAHTRQKFELKATPANLRTKVLQVRDDLRNPFADPKPHLAELYAMVVAPLADELKTIEQIPPGANADKNSVPTLLWSLDGVLRYLPMAALYDGHHYMLDRFNNVLFTPESYGHMGAPANPGAARLRVLAMGLSKSFGGLPALPGVMPELEAVVRDPAMPKSHGPMEGKLLPNEQFTLAALKSELGAGKSFPVVHIASHFIEDATSGEEPYLMLGGENAGDEKGFALTLSSLEDSTISFHGTELLTLSACSTAKGDAAKDGQEMDSLGMIAQQKDAGAVLATLWDVNDASTSLLMSDFYSRWLAHPAEGKAESLRQAQLALVHNAKYEHPFFWAPFVLIGNFQ
jgi:CHAT domain-containing protein/Flp pilus assembly protein TadD